MNTLEGMIKDLNKSELVADDGETDICTTSGELITALKRLQRYEDLEEQGRLIELPCKIGDTVYYITGIHNTLIKPAKVEEVYFGDVFAVHVSTQNTSFTLVEGEFFLTKEEAEAALKEVDK